MFNQLLANNLIVVLIVWAIVYGLDYYLTILAARWYRLGANEYMTFGGSLELTPVFQKDVDALSPLSRVFVSRWLISLALIAVLWVLAVSYLRQPEVFAFGAGGLILREVPVFIRHGRNLFVFRQARRPDAMQGQLHQARWFTLKISAVEVFGYGIFFLLLALAMSEWFLLGGAVGCLVVSQQHWRLANKARRAGLQPSTPAADQSS
jgi:hypothetical protein